MNFQRVAVGILFISLASQACQQATAQQPTPVNQLVGDYHESQLASCLSNYPHGDFYSAWNDPCPSCYVQVGALLLQREPRFTNQPIAIDPGTNATLLSTSDLNFNVDPGMQATLGWCLSEGRNLEIDYFGLFEGTASSTRLVDEDGNMVLVSDGFGLNVFDDLDRIQVNYTSSIHSVAVNLFNCCGCSNACDCCDSCSSCDSCNPCGGRVVSTRSLSWFGGFRYLNVRERMDILGRRFTIDGPEDGSYNLQTSNNLFGAQLGARVRRTRGRFGWDATGFAGIFANNSRQRQSLTEFPDFAVRPRVSSSSTDAAFVGGANLSGHYLLTDVWALRAGYNVLWIEGVALAPDQLDFAFAQADGGTRLDNNGGMFLHGVNVGLEARW